MSCHVIIISKIVFPYLTSQTTKFPSFLNFMIVVEQKKDIIHTISIFKKKTLARILKG